MKNYAFFISEHNVVRYIVEAETEREAEELLNDWIDGHTEQIANEMDRSYPGWDIDYDGETTEAPDITKGWRHEEA